MRYLRTRPSNKNQEFTVHEFACGGNELQLLIDICEKKRNEVNNIFELSQTKNRLNNFIREFNKALKE